MGKLLISVSIFALAAVLCFGQANFTRGEELFMQNKPGEALVFLENTIAEDPANIKAYLYLGVVYEQLNRNDEAIAAYRRVHSRAGDLAASVSTNLANVYFRKGDLEYAERFYSQALAEDSVYASAYLGRANTRIQTGSLRDAVADYEMYLSLEPRSPKRNEINRMVTFVRSEFAAEERRKLLAEEAARAEALRRQRLLEELAQSLQEAAGDSQGLSAGADKVEDYDSEFELE